MQKEMVDAHQDGMNIVHIQIEEQLFDAAFPPYGSGLKDGIYVMSLLEDGQYVYMFI